MSDELASRDPALSRGSGEDREDTRFSPMIRRLVDEFKATAWIDEVERVQRGVSTFLIDEHGNEFPQGFHEIQELELRDAQEPEATYKKVVGRAGSCSYLLARNPQTGEITMSEGMNEGFELRQDLGGMIVGRNGAFRYILDPLTGRRLSEGYHDFRLKDGKLLGKRGAAEELVLFES